MHLLVLYFTFDILYTTIHKLKENKPISEVKQANKKKIDQEIKILKCIYKLSCDNYRIDTLLPKKENSKVT